MSLARAVGAVAGKDLRLELRGRHAANLILPFVASNLILLGIALGPGRTILEPASPSILWATLIFASVLEARRSFQAEEEDGASEGLLLAPVEKSAIYAGKVLALWGVLVLIGALAGLMGVVLFDLSFRGDVRVVAAALVLGALGLSAAGCLFGGLVSSARAREAVLPLLVLPIVIPVAVGGIRATSLAMAGQNEPALSWLGLLAAFDAAFLAAGVLLFDKVLED